MHSTQAKLALSVCLFSLLIFSDAAELPLPVPPTPTPPGNVVINPPSTPGVNPEESIPVVISYGQNQETRARVYRGVMEPVGLLPSQSVTVTLMLPPTRAGEPVSLSLYDGGQVGAATLPGSENISLSDDFAVLDTGTVRFNFKAGRTLGLYRLLVAIGPGQYLLQFYAVKPRPAASPPPF